MALRREPPQGRLTKLREVACETQKKIKRPTLLF
nr:MAG TPA: hypothetical protein [Caudoviricetes sp.]